MITIRSI